MANLAGLRVYPVKGLDGIAVEGADVLDGGTLEHDREFALFDEDGDVLNGKRTDRVHDLTTDFEPETGTLAVATPDGETQRFVLDQEQERERAATWFSDFFGIDLTLKRDSTLGFVDRRELGPSVVSTATLREIASWFENLTPESVRRRLRANIEIDGVPAFWEDRFVGDDAPTFRIGSVGFEGIKPCGRCVVPERDPDTGERLADFRERFVERREETFPVWADADAFEHLYSVMLIAGVPESDRGQRLRVGDDVTVHG
jgi:uncharacterized protein YcbX